MKIMDMKILKGFSKYEITDDGEKIRIWSLYHKNWLRGDSSGKGLFWLIDDDRVNRHVSYGFLRFLMRHPEIDARDISPLRQRIKFSENGDVLDLYPDTPRARRCDVFNDIDDALVTVLAMKAAAKGDMKFLYRFISKHRERATLTVASLLKTTAHVVEGSVAEGEELFISQVTTARCRSIIPLYAWLCRCIKSAVLLKRNMVQVDKVTYCATSEITD